MKSFVIFITLFAATLASYAQEHLSFKGIPIQGSMTSFCQKLKAKGFTAIGTDNNISIFSGDFTGRDAIVGVVATSDGADVYSVGVLLPASEEWKTLVNTYDYYKDLYTRKYGEPTACRENNPARDDSNIALMAEVHQGTVTYASAWQVTGGAIELSIQKTDGVYRGQVLIKYQDSQNVEAKLQKDLDDI